MYATVPLLYCLIFTSASLLSQSTRCEGSSSLPDVDCPRLISAGLWFRIERFSPHVIAGMPQFFCHITLPYKLITIGIFYGHTHEDQFMVYYGNNASVISSKHALATAWVGLVT